MCGVQATHVIELTGWSVSWCGGVRLSSQDTPLIGHRPAYELAATEQVTNYGPDQWRQTQNKDCRYGGYSETFTERDMVTDKYFTCQARKGCWDWKTVIIFNFWQPKRQGWSHQAHVTQLIMVCLKLKSGSLYIVGAEIQNINTNQGHAYHFPCWQNFNIYFSGVSR